jgi:hypothetical protein
MNELPKHRALMLLVKSIAGSGTPLRVVHANSDGAWEACASPKSTRVPAKSAWLPADITELRMTVFIKDAAAATGKKNNYRYDRLKT